MEINTKNNTNIIYTVDSTQNIYVNLTNRCPLHCAFCVRHTQAKTENSLWLEREPTAEEVWNALQAYPPSPAGEIVFCGFGEPFCAMDVMLDVCCRLKAQNSNGYIRINTNGLGDLIHQKPVARLLAGLVDCVSISLNAPTETEYNKICLPGDVNPSESPFNAMIKFAQSCKNIVPCVRFTVVEGALSPARLAACQTLADNAGIPLVIRKQLSIDN